MARSDTTWPTYRIKRLFDILEYKAQGLTDEEAGKKVGVSRGTVSRDLNSPQADEIGRAMRSRAGTMVWTLFEKQLNQIETDVSLKPAQKLIYRGQLIQTLTSLVPKQVEQKVSGEIEQKVKMIDVTEEDLISVVSPVVNELMARRAKGIDSSIPEEDPEESLDRVET